MIPKNSTPIKNKILIDIIAKNKLSMPEMRIIAYIIRWSWGFDGISRRQDWTKKITKRQIADDINMKESQLNKVINRMIIKNKLIVKDNFYQFNEHYEDWKLNGELSFNEEKNLTGSEVKLNGELNKLNGELNKLNGELSPTDLKPLQGKPLRDRKETLKKTIKKKKEKRILFNFNKKEFINLTKEKMEEFDEKYPGVDIDQQIERMENWLMKEKEKRDKGEKNKIPKDYSQFIYNWLKKEEQE